MQMHPFALLTFVLSAASLAVVGAATSPAAASAWPLSGWQNGSTFVQQVRSAGRQAPTVPGFPKTVPRASTTSLSCP